MAKVLVTAHLGRHFRVFGRSDYEVLLKMGHEVHIAANFNDEIDKFEHKDVIKHQIDFDRNPFSIQNIKAYKQLKKLIIREKYDLIHTQSPSGGAITRLAAKKVRKKGCKVLYTAHGLHFFKGSPMKNWIMYYNFEKILSKYTDCIITINKEDYNNAVQKLRVSDVRHVYGVGVDLEKFAPLSNDKKLKVRKEYSYKEDDFIIIYVGELSFRKNQSMAIEVIEKLKEKIPNVCLLLVGEGDLKEQYIKSVNDMNLDKNVRFLGYRQDVNTLMQLSDICISTSRQEGLPVNIMEAMGTGLPIVVTDCRGNRDLVINNKNGYVIENNDINKFAEAIIKIYSSQDIRERFKLMNLEFINNYSIEEISKNMELIYSDYIE